MHTLIFEVIFMHASAFYRNRKRTPSTKSVIQKSKPMPISNAQPETSFADSLLG